MYKFETYVNPSEIWENAKDYVDEGNRPGLVRGYNIEVDDLKGNTGWLSCSYFYGEPVHYFNDEFHTWMYEEHGWVPTGRICFRGYGIEEYDYEERDSFIVPCDADGNIIK